MIKIALKPSYTPNFFFRGLRPRTPRSLTQISESTMTGCTGPCIEPLPMRVPTRSTWIARMLDS